jgi:hypothetical protein
MDEAKKTSAGETAEANGAYDGGDVNCRSIIAQTAAEVKLRTLRNNY